MPPTAMKREISCQNFRGLLVYLGKHYGEAAIQKVTEGLVNNDHYLLADQKDPSRLTQVQERHLMDSSYWVSNEFSLRLLASVKKVVPGPDPLFTAGEGATLENFSRNTLFVARVVGPKVLARQAPRLNALFNKTKTVELPALSDHSATFRLTYLPDVRVTEDVCHWNRGIYSGITRSTGAKDVEVRETTCVLAGDPYCTLQVTWKRVGLAKQLFRQLMKAGLSDLIADYGKALQDRDQLIEELSRSEQRYRSLTDHSLTGIFIAQDQGFIYVNDGLAKILGFSSDELIGKSFADLVLSDYTEAVQSLDSSASGGEQAAQRGELQVRRKDGSFVWLEILSSTIPFRDSQARMGNVIDISARKTAEEEKRSLEERLLRSQKMEALGLLAGGVAHDLNNILSGIVTYPELLLLDLPEESPLRQPLITIQDSGLKAVTIIQDLLTLARRGVTQTQVTNLNDLISTYLRSPEHEKIMSFHPGIRIKTSLEADLPNISGSPTHLVKTVMNLVSNAAEAQPGEGEILISTESCYLDSPFKGYQTVPEGEYALLKIQDRGIGIAPEDLQRIFEPFYTKKVMGRSGTGLGMAVVWGTVQDHRGYLQVTSEIGRGSAFALYFPITRQARGPEIESLPLEAYLGHQEKVLVIDDLLEQREIAQKILIRLGYQVFSVASGEEAVEFLKNTPVDVLLLDMIMDPGIDGLETYQRILKIHPRQKAVISSGFSETDRVLEAQCLGARGYLKKPYTLEKLGLALREELHRLE